MGVFPLFPAKNQQVESRTPKRQVPWQRVPEGSAKIRLSVIEGVIPS